MCIIYQFCYFKCNFVPVQALNHIRYSIYNSLLTPNRAVVSYTHATIVIKCDSSHLTCTPCTMFVVAVVLRHRIRVIAINVIWCTRILVKNKTKIFTPTLKPNRRTKTLIACDIRQFTSLLEMEEIKLTGNRTVLVPLR